MEKCNKRKRVLDDSEADSPESTKQLRVGSESDVNFSESQLNRVNPGESSDEFELDRVDPVLDSSGVNEIQDDLLKMLNDAENVNPAMQVQGLDSVIKSFEEEILAPSSDPNVNLSGEFKPNLGYLLEASDDELGLPPTEAPANEETRKPGGDDPGRVGPEGLDLTGFWGFEDDVRNYEGFGFVGYDVEDNGGGYVTIDGLFDYAEPTTDILWRSESLQAM
ncbi:hypothetical protein RJT34_04753 [Clitoria ternatea]|uniref:Uncharacterized protein n=1 Tax=Clitoria ternatea TaxID=43366 RepID=A0AAN9KMQ0_CLITE